MAEPALLEARGLSVRSRSRVILDGVDLELRAGEVLALVGPSGVGKSTLLGCFNRLLELGSGLEASGTVLVRGRPVDELEPDLLRQRVGLLGQRPVLFPGSVLDNVVFAIRRLGVPRRELLGRAEAALREADLWRELSQRLGEPARHLSVGQAQRLCLARTLAGRPEVLLMDEPTSSLDPHSARAIEERLSLLAREHGLVLVTHDLEQARRVATRVGCLLPVDGVGRLVECSSELLERPRDPRVAAYVRRTPVTP